MWIDPPNTPVNVYAYFYGLQSCPARPVPPNGETFQMIQVGGSPCRWSNAASPSPWRVSLFLLGPPLRSELYLDRAGKGYFYGLGGGSPPEYDPYDNDYVICTGSEYAHSGNAFIFWLDVVDDLVTNLNLPVDGDGLFLETFNTGTADIVMRFANITYDLNKKILFTP